MLIAIRALRAWSARQWCSSVAGAVLAAAALGLATGSIPNPVTFRQLPVPWWGYLLWSIAALLTGLLVGTYVVPTRERTHERKAAFGGVLSVFALGCPICNKLVLLALGASGALSWFEPLQPVLALVSVGLLGEAVRRRLAGSVRCPVPAAQADTSRAR